MPNNHGEIIDLTLDDDDDDDEEENVDAARRQTSIIGGTAVVAGATATATPTSTLPSTTSLQIKQEQLQSIVTHNNNKVVEGTSASQPTPSVSPAPEAALATNSDRTDSDRTNGGDYDDDRVQREDTSLQTSITDCTGAAAAVSTTTTSTDVRKSTDESSKTSLQIKQEELTAKISLLTKKVVAEKAPASQADSSLPRTPALANHHTDDNNDRLKPGEKSGSALSVSSIQTQSTSAVSANPSFVLTTTRDSDYDDPNNSSSDNNAAAAAAATTTSTADATLCSSEVSSESPASVEKDRCPGPAETARTEMASTTNNHVDTIMTTNATTTAENLTEAAGTQQEPEPQTKSCLDSHDKSSTNNKSIDSNSTTAAAREDQPIPRNSLDNVSGTSTLPEATTGTDKDIQNDHDQASQSSVPDITSVNGDCSGEPSRGANDIVGSDSIETPNKIHDSSSSPSLPVNSNAPVSKSTRNNDSGENLTTTCHPGAAEGDANREGSKAHSSPSFFISTTAEQYTFSRKRLGDVDETEGEQQQSQSQQSFTSSTVTEKVSNSNEAGITTTQTKRRRHEDESSVTTNGPLHLEQDRTPSVNDPMDCDESQPEAHLRNDNDETQTEERFETPATSAHAYTESVGGDKEKSSLESMNNKPADLPEPLETMPSPPLFYHALFDMPPADSFGDDTECNEAYVDKEGSPVSEESNNEDDDMGRPDDPMCWGDRVLTPCEMEVLFLGEESKYCLNKKHYQFDFIWHFASRSLRVELRKLNVGNSNHDPSDSQDIQPSNNSDSPDTTENNEALEEKRNLSQLVRMHDSLVPQRFDYLSQLYRQSLVKGFRRKSMALDIATMRLERPPSFK